MLNSLYRRMVDDVGIVDMLTAIVYGIALLALLAVLGIWWMFLVLVAALAIGGAWRVARTRRASAQH